MKKTFHRMGYCVLHNYPLPEHAINLFILSICIIAHNLTHKSNNQALKDDREPQILCINKSRAWINYTVKNGTKWEDGNDSKITRLLRLLRCTCGDVTMITAFRTKLPNSSLQECRGVWG